MTHKFSKGGWVGVQQGLRIQIPYPVPVPAHELITFKRALYLRAIHPSYPPYIGIITTTPLTVRQSRQLTY